MYYTNKYLDYPLIFALPLKLYNRNSLNYLLSVGKIVQKREKAKLINKTMKIKNLKNKHVAVTQCSIINCAA